MSALFLKYDDPVYFLTPRFLLLLTKNYHSACWKKLLQIENYHNITKEHNFSKKKKKPVDLSTAREKEFAQCRVKINRT